MQKFISVIGNDCVWVGSGRIALAEPKVGFLLGHPQNLTVGNRPSFSRNQRMNEWPVLGSWKVASNGDLWVFQVR